MHWLQYNQAGTLAADLPHRPDAAGAFVVSDAGGGTVQSSTAAVLDTVDTTLSAQAAAGALTLTLTTTAGMAAGRRYLVGGPEPTGGETVTVRSVDSGTQVTLVRRLRAARALGVTLQGTRVSFALNAIATIGRGYAVAYTYATGGVAQPPYQLVFDVTLYAPRSYLTLEDVRDVDPLLAKHLPEGSWLPAVVDLAWRRILRRLAASVKPGAFKGIVDFTDCHAYAVRLALAESGGNAPELVAHRELLTARFLEEFAAVTAVTPVDTNQDGKVDSWEAFPRGIPLLGGA